MEKETQSALKNQSTTDLRIPIYFAWIMALLGLVLPFIILSGPFEKWNDSMGLFGACLSILIFIWLLFLFDAIRSKIKNKPFWVLSIIIMPTVAQVVYLFRKKKILYLNDETHDK